MTINKNTRQANVLHSNAVKKGEWVGTRVVCTE